MTLGRRTNRIVLLAIAMLFSLAMLTSAQEAPDVIASGAIPYLVTFADSVDFSFGSVDWVFVEGTIDQINRDDSTIILSGTYSWGPNVVLQNRIVVSITRSTTITRNDRSVGLEDLIISDWALVSGTQMTSDIQPLPGSGEPGGMIEASTVDASSARPNRR